MAALQHLRQCVQTSSRSDDIPLLAHEQINDWVVKVGGVSTHVLILYKVRRRFSDPRIKLNRIAGLGIMFQSRETGMFISVQPNPLRFSKAYVGMSPLILFQARFLAQGFEKFYSRFVLTRNGNRRFVIGG